MVQINCVLHDDAPIVVKYCSDLAEKLENLSDQRDERFVKTDSNSDDLGVISQRLIARAITNLS